MTKINAAITGIHGWVPDYILNNAQPQTGAFVFGGEKGIPNLLIERLIDPLAGILYRDFHRFVRPAHAYQDQTTAGHCLHGIDKQI